jgi:uncharacterized protein YjbI with pentapeptide repeats
MTKPNRIEAVVCAILTGLVLVGVGALGVRLRPYWVARYRGADADLRGAVLIGAPLRGVDLHGAELPNTDLRGADLRDADLKGADLSGANLDGAVFLGAVYDLQTSWPAGFVPQHAGAVLESLQP